MTQSPALVRANELFNAPVNGIPPMAMAYLHELSKRLGVCAEAYITAYAAYAQEIEGLTCNERDYISDAEAKAWFAEASTKEWYWAEVGDNKIRAVYRGAANEPVPLDDGERHRVIQLD